MVRAKTTFLYILALGSILGFLTTAILSFFKLDVTGYATSVLFILIGLGLMIEGEFRKILRMSKNGFSGVEISHITASVIGFMAVLTGAINLVGSIYSIDALLTNETFSIIKGILSVIAIVVIIVETWVIK